MRKLVISQDLLEAGPSFIEGVYSRSAEDLAFRPIGNDVEGNGCIVAFVVWEVIVGEETFEATDGVLEG